VREYEVEPEDFGLAMASSRNLRVENAQESKAMLLEALSGTPGVPHDIVCLNAGAALYAADVVGSIADGIELARTAIASGAATAKIDAFVSTTRKLVS
jgi:anthranilate phosphoribosyltransferase